MAMTKGETERMKALEAAVKDARALRWPDYPEPSPVTKEVIEANRQPGGTQFGRPQFVMRGWFANSYGKRVGYGCSSGNTHSFEGDTTSSQGAGEMYLTEIEAWRKIRLDKTREFARSLAEIDAKIEAAKGE